MSPAFIAAVRSAVQYLIALLLTFLASKGIEVPADFTEVVFVPLFGAIVYLLNKLGDKFPIINRVISLGASADTPSYTRAA